MAIANGPMAVSSFRRFDMATLNPRLAEQFGRYRIIKRLGQGGMGSVYLAQDTHLERAVALKIPDFGEHDGANARRRFLEEARTAATLDHPYLCPVFDAGEIDGQPYLTMAFIEGKSLAALIGDEGWPQRQVAALVGKLALALQEAHTQKVIHRDLKPANVMIKTTGQRREPVIVDFGLARRDNPQEQRLTRTGQVMGTLGYMAPEQVRGDLNEIGPACDIYALGVILYELLTGRLPFNDSGLAVAAQILTEPPLPPSTHRSNLDPALEAICLKAMAKAIGDRYATMAELAAALTGFLQSPLASATPAASVASPASSASDTRPRPAGSSSLVALFLGQLAENTSTPTPALAPELVASRAPLPGRRWRAWPTVAAACVLGPILLVVMNFAANKRSDIRDIEQGHINSATERATRVVKTGGHQNAAPRIENVLRTEKQKSADTERVAKPNPFEEEKWAGAERPPERKPFEKVAPADKVKVAEQNPYEKEKSTVTEGIVESNPWPEALAPGGHVLPLWDRILAMSPDCRCLAVATQTDMKIVAAPDASKMFEMKGQRPANGSNAGYIWAAAFSPDGKYVAFSLHDLQVGICETTSGKEVCRMSLFPGTSLAYSPDGKRLAVSGRHKKFVSVGDATTGKKLVDLSPHSALTDCLAFSPDGQWLASGSGAEPEDSWGMTFGTGSDLKIWNLETHRGHALEGHLKRVNAVTFSPDGKRLASASSDRTVKVWDLATKKCLAIFDKHQASVKFVRFSPDGHLIASGADEKSVRVWDAATGREIAILNGLRAKPEFVQFSVEGHWIYSGARSTLKAWKSPTIPGASDIAVLAGPTDERSAQEKVEKPAAPEHKLDAPKLEFLPLFNGKNLAGWKRDPKQPGNWYVQNRVLVGNGPSISHLYTERDDFTDFHLRIEARFNIGGSGGVYFRSPFGARLPADDPKWPDGYEATINDAEVVLKSTGALYTGVGNGVSIADFGIVTRVPPELWFTLEVIADGDALAILVNGTRTAYHVDRRKERFSSGHIAVQRHGPETMIEFRKIEIKELNRWNQRDPKEIRRFPGAVGRVNQVAFSADGTGILIGGNLIEYVKRTGGGNFFNHAQYTLRLEDLSGERNLFTVNGGGLNGGALALSSDGRYAASSAGSRSEHALLIWDVRSGTQIHRLSRNFENSEPVCTAVSFSPDDHRVLAALTGGTLLVWDLATEHEQPPITLKAGPITHDEFPCAAFTSDRRQVVTARRNGILELWKLESGKKSQRFAGHTGEVSNVMSSPDGRLILSAGTDGTVRLWDMANGKELKRFRSDDRRVTCVAFAPDGRRALSAGVYGIVHLWDLASGKEVCRMEGHTMGVNSVAFSPDGRRAVSGSDDRTVQLWQLPE
jgi:WD40 repeat protein/serine/threonine protein kinase